MYDYAEAITRDRQQYQDLTRERRNRVKIFLCVIFALLFSIGCHLLLIRLENFDLQYNMNAGAEGDYETDPMLRLYARSKYENINVRLIVRKLGSRNTSVLVKPHLNTILVDSTNLAKTANNTYLQSIPIPNQNPMGKHDHDFNSKPPPFEKETTADPLPLNSDGQSQTKAENQAKCPFAIFVVLSDFESATQRNAIRESWAQWTKLNNNFHDGTRVVFFLAVPPENRLPFISEKIGKLHEEKTQFDDILVDDVIEDYYLMSVKVLRILKWFSMTYPQDGSGSCPRPHFLVKVEQGVFINMPNFLHHLHTIKDNQNEFPNYIGGILYPQSETISDLKRTVIEAKDTFFTPNLASNFFPPYLAGPCYILDGDLAVRIYEASLNLLLFHIEDLFITGVIANATLNSPLYDLREPRIMKWNLDLNSNTTFDSKSVVNNDKRSHPEIIETSTNNDSFSSTGPNSNGQSILVEQQLAFQRELNTSLFFFPVAPDQMLKYYAILKTANL